MNKYNGEFTSREDVAFVFEEVRGGSYWDRKNATINETFPTEDEIIYANYDVYGYEGSAFVVFEHDGDLFEVHGSHCSCFGLEGQWSPEPTSWEAIATWNPAYSGVTKEIVDEAKRRVAAKEAVASAKQEL